MEGHREEAKELTEDERHSIRYALTELANRRAEQSIDQKDVELGKSSHKLRDLADRIAKGLTG